MPDKKHVLIADDDPAILDSVKLLLEEFGYAVSVTGNGGELLRLKPPLPAILLLDIWMSGWDGYKICRQLKTGPRTKDMPIIMISANKDTPRIAAEAGADDFLQKPFDADALVDKIEKYLKA